MQTYSWIDKNNAIMETARRTQEIFEAIKPAIPVVPPSLLQELGIASKINIPQINIPQFGFPTPNNSDGVMDYYEDISDDEDIVDENKTTPESGEDHNVEKY